MVYSKIFLGMYNYLYRRHSTYINKLCASVIVKTWEENSFPTLQQIHFFFFFSFFFFHIRIDLRPVRNCSQTKRQAAPCLNSAVALGRGSTLPVSGKLGFSLCESRRAEI